MHALHARTQTHAGPLICLPLVPAPQRLHRFEVWVTRAADGKTGKAYVGEMTEEKSIELASKLASEGFVFGVSCHGSSSLSLSLLFLRMARLVS